MTHDDLTEYDLDRRQFMAIAGALTGSTALAGCSTQSGDGSDAGGGGTGTGSDSGGGSESTPSGSSDVRLNVAISAEPWNFDPALWSDTATSTIGGLIYDEVVGLNSNEELVPELVEEVPDPMDGGKAYEYTLREGVKFHNGDPVTAEDVKYTVDWILNPDNNSPIASRIPFVESTEVVDDRTFRFNMEKPFATLNWWITRGIAGVVPKDSRDGTSEGKGPSGVATNLTKDPSGMGTGPFKFVEWKSGSHVLLERNENYWKDGQPKVKEIKFDFIGENSTRLANLRSGNTHLTNKVPPKDFKGLKGQPNIDATSVPGNTTEVLYLNLMEAEGNPMSNVNNRRAVMFGIDAEEILDEVFHGQGVVQKGPWYPDSEWTSPKLKEMEFYDPEKARKELEKAGNPDGFELDIIATKGSWFKDEAIIIQEQLSNIGIDVNVTAVDKSTLFDEVYGTTDWHAAMEDWGQSIPVATYWLDAGYADNNHNHNNWHHAADDLQDPYEASGPPAPEDAEGDFSNGHDWFVQTLRKAQSETDEQKQKELVYKLEEFVTLNAIQIDIAYVNKLQAWQQKVEGYQVGTFHDEFRTTLVGDGN
jgi:peptide/nickel transport system substrate-binding protein